MIHQLRGVLLLLAIATFGYAKITDETDAGEGERAMKELEAAKVKMEEKIEEMSTYIDNELQVKELQSADFKRKKRQADGGDKNPLSSLDPQKIVGMMKKMDELRIEFEELTEHYNVQKEDTESADEEAESDDEPTGDDAEEADGGAAKGDEAEGDEAGADEAAPDADAGADADAAVPDAGADAAGGDEAGADEAGADEAAPDARQQRISYLVLRCYCCL